MLIGAQAQHLLILGLQLRKSFHETLVVGVANDDGFGPGLEPGSLPSQLGGQSTSPSTRPARSVDLMASHAVQPRKFPAGGHALDLLPRDHEDLRGGVICVLRWETPVAVAADVVEVIGIDPIELRSVLGVGCHSLPSHGNLWFAYAHNGLCGYTQCCLSPTSDVGT